MAAGRFAYRRARRRAACQPVLPSRPGRPNRGALRQDPPLRRRSSGWQELARVGPLRSGRDRRAGPTSMGRAGHERLLRSPLSGALLEARSGGRGFPRGAVRVHPNDRARPLACAAEGARHRDGLLRHRTRPVRRPRGRAGELRALAGGGTVGRDRRGRRRGGGLRPRRDRPCQGPRTPGRRSPRFGTPGVTTRRRASARRNSRTRGGRRSAAPARAPGGPPRHARKR